MDEDLRPRPPDTTMEAEDKSGREEVGVDDWSSHWVRLLGGSWDRGVMVGDALSSGVDFSKEVGRMEMSLSDSLEMTLARALPA